jgi:restriction endonuclease S subunit
MSAKSIDTVVIHEERGIIFNGRCAEIIGINFIVRIEGLTYKPYQVFYHLQLNKQTIKVHDSYTPIIIDLK